VIARSVASLTLAALLLDANSWRPPVSQAAEIVELFVTATNARGQAVRHLTLQDFELMDGDKAAEILSVRPAQETFTGGVIFDVSSSMAPIGESLAHAAAAVGSHLRSGDRLWPATVAQRTLIAPSPVETRAQLIEAANQLRQPHGPSPLWDALAKMMDTMRGESGRRVVVAYTDGRVNGNTLDAESVMRRAIADGYVVYFVSPEEREAAAVPGFAPPGEALENFSRATGGTRLVAMSRPGGGSASRVGIAFAGLMSELRAQYRVTFRAAVGDGAFRTLTVRVLRPGVTARTRTVYLSR